MEVSYCSELLEILNKAMKRVGITVFVEKMVISNRNKIIKRTELV